MDRPLAIVMTLALAAVASAVPMPAAAQRKYRLEMRPQPPPGNAFGRHYEDVDYPTPEKRAANLSELLNLTDDQKQKVQAIFVDQDKQGLALWSDESLTDEARAKRRVQIRDEATKKVRDLLTDEQRKKYDALSAEPKPADKVRLQPDPRR